MAQRFQKGLSTLNKEINLDYVPVQGTLPPWLTGTLLRNGPALFEVGHKKFRHWFDGQAMLHKFAFQEGHVSYASRFVVSKGYQSIKKTGKVNYKEFATDPCRSLFKRLTTLFSLEFSNNTNVSIMKLNDKLLALTETPMPIEFDPQTLETIGVHTFADEDFPDGQTTPHPHFDFKHKVAINNIVSYGKSSTYNLYTIDPNTNKRTVIGTHSVPEPGYMHSFALTEHYIILVEFPLFLNPLSLFLSGKPLIENYVWKPERGTRFLVFNRSDGKLVDIYVHKAFFAFHHINAFELSGDIFIDIAVHPDTRIIDDLYMDHLLGPKGGAISQGEFRRYKLALSQPGTNEVTSELITDEVIELPTTNYRQANAGNYHYAYGISQHKDTPNDFSNQLIKVDVQHRTTKTWHVDGCYPGEPIFVAAPDATNEDDGVILSVVFDGIKENSFLLVLDGPSFTEIARAEVPHHIPLGFHGLYTR